MQVFKQLRPKAPREQLAALSSVLQQVLLVVATGQPLTAEQVSLMFAGMNGGAVSLSDMQQLGLAEAVMQVQKCTSDPPPIVEDWEAAALAAAEAQGGSEGGEAEEDPLAVSWSANPDLDRLVSPTGSAAAAEAAAAVVGAVGVASPKGGECALVGALLDLAEEEYRSPARPAPPAVGGRPSQDTVSKWGDYHSWLSAELCSRGMAFDSCWLC